VTRKVNVFGMSVIETLMNKKWEDCSPLERVIVIAWGIESKEDTVRTQTERAAEDLSTLQKRVEVQDKKLIEALVHLSNANALLYEFQNNPNIELGEVGHKKIEDYFNGAV
jgi:hypothetical protein